MEKLSRKILDKELINSTIDINELLNLPEKILQFGTGVLLRGLPDYIIDKANKAGLYGGRIVVVKSTDGPNSFEVQDNLYTTFIQGVKDDVLVKENSINMALSRVLLATKQWETILEVADSKDLEVIISNTTEAGIVLELENIFDDVPNSFPGKLLSILHRRFTTFKGDSTKGLIIIPTELISNNGDVLKSILLDLAKHNQLNVDFTSWLIDANMFCNSLVDRIVPGKPRGDEAKELAQELNYEDSEMIVAEPYALWAIQGNSEVDSKLGFCKVNEGAFVVNDITKYKELKLRLLNGTHTLTCGLAYLAGFGSVKNAMKDEDFLQFINNLMVKEIGKSIPYAITEEEIESFSSNVIDRFKNPFLEHFWINITLVYTQKIELRIVPLLIEYYRKNQEIPSYMAAGLAGYFKFMTPVVEKSGKYYGFFNGEEYLINDPKAEFFYKLFKQGLSSTEVLETALGDKELWGTDLSELDGLVNKVQTFRDILEKHGAKSLMKELITQN